MFNKKNLQTLALGFFLSGSLVAAFLFIEGDRSSGNASGDQEVEALEQEVTNLEDEIARLEVAQAEDSQEVEEQTSDTEEETNDNAGDEEQEDQNEEEQEPEEEENEVTEATITVEEGQPSSVATQQLVDAEIIDDQREFELFLDDNDYAVLIRPGTYEVNSDMSFDDLAAALRGQ